MAVRSQRAWPLIHQRLAGISPDYLTGSHCPCPIHKGKDKWRVFDDYEETGGAVCNQCGKMADGFDVLRAVAGLSLPDAVNRVGELLNIPPKVVNPSRKKGQASAPKAPDADLEFLPWNSSLAAMFGLKKRPITEEALLLAGARCATYTKAAGTKWQTKIPVFAIPIRNYDLAGEVIIVGWCIYHVTGKPIPVWNKTTKQDDYFKVKVQAGSKAGWIGSQLPIGSNPQSLAPAQVIHKTEGPTDLLGLLSLDLLPGHYAICNPFGAGEDPASHPELLNVFSSVPLAVVIHDADLPGQNGALEMRSNGPGGRSRPGWAPAIANFASETRNYQLPYPVAESHGKDLRDWINEQLDAGLTRSAVYEAFLANASTMPIVQPQPIANRVDSAPSSASTLTPAAAATLIASASPQTNSPNQSSELDDDPFRLARINLQQYEATEGGTLRYWRDEWYAWKKERGCYRRISTSDLRAKIALCIKQEFDRLHTENPRVSPKKVTTSLVTNVLQATTATQLIPSHYEICSVIKRNAKGAFAKPVRRNWIALKNGILDVDAILAGKDDSECFFPHTPDWFSPICLPYEFSPDAECPIWEAFLQKNMAADDERIRILQEWAGYLLLPDTGHQKFLMMIGEGSNGKSVYCGAIESLVGYDNCSFVALEAFEDRFAKTSTLGKLVNISSDAGEIDKAAEGILKSFTAGETMMFDRKGISPVSALPTARLMVACNNKPRFSDRSDGIWRRMIVIPWDVKILDHEKIRNMDKAWWWEKSGELPGMFNWALAGLYRLTQQGEFTKSSAADAAKDEYKDETNPVRQFFDIAIEPESSKESSSSITAEKFYWTYQQWCYQYGYKPMSASVFGREIKRHFPASSRVRAKDAYGMRFYRYEGLRLVISKVNGKNIFESESEY